MAHPDGAREIILNSWSHFTGAQIADILAEQSYDMTKEQVMGVVVAARAKGDKRAVKKTRAVYGVVA